MAFLLKKIESLRRRHNIHVFLCGLRGSGKTTLLYKSLLNGWNNIYDEIEPTTLYHYEELAFDGKKYGIWDFSGDIKVSYIPAYVAQQVQVTAVVFVVDVMDESENGRREVIDRIHKLETEDALGQSLFIVLFNRHSHGDHNNSGTEYYIRDQFVGSNRISFFTSNAALGLEDQNWVNVLKLIQFHHKKLGNVSN